ncbi:MAG: NADH-quinone oxidoreductase subunit J [Bdellovibrionales bacterium]|jgi:NADH-quinone oxidoreductase subunit J
MIAGALFCVFALVLIASAVAVVSVRQPVTAVLFLILCFFNAAGLFLLLGAEFLAFILLIVYVGAVAVLFLFVVMMLDVKGGSPSAPLKRFLPASLGVGAVLLAQMVVMAVTWPQAHVALPVVADMENTSALGRVLYTDFIYPFQVSGFVLLTAMIGAIVLTQRGPRGTKRQNVQAQLDRRAEDVVTLHDVKSGKGAL